MYPNASESTIKLVENEDDIGTLICGCFFMDDLEMLKLIFLFQRWKMDSFSNNLPCSNHTRSSLLHCLPRLLLLTHMQHSPQAKQHPKKNHLTNEESKIQRKNHLCKTLRALGVGLTSFNSITVSTSRGC